MGARQTKEDSLSVTDSSIIWTIENFSSLTKNYDSKIFNVSDDEKTKWYIRIYPNGDTEGNKNFIGLFLVLNESSSDLTVRYKIEIISSDSERTISRSGIYTYKQSEYAAHGFNRIIARDGVLNQRYGFLINNKLTIRCEISILCTETAKGIECVLANMQQLLKLKLFNDCVIVCPDGEVAANKFLLASQSTVFRAMFTNDTKEARTGRVIVDDVSRETMQVN